VVHVWKMVVVAVCVDTCLHECVYCVYVRMLTKNREKMLGVPIMDSNPVSSCMSTMLSPVLLVIC